jgi:tetratricopeptide (TPR) repeat protein
VVILIILFIVGFFYLHTKLTIPLIIKLTDNIKNKTLNSLISISLVITLLSSTLFLIIFIIKILPLPKENTNDTIVSDFSSKAYEYKKNHKYEEAYIQFDSAEKYSKDSLQFHYEKALLKFEVEKYLDAVQLLNKLDISDNNSDSSKSEIYELRSQCYFILNDYQKSISDLKKILLSNFYSNTDYICDLNIQISINYLLIKNTDSSFRYLLDAEKNNISNVYIDENDKIDKFKEINLLRALIFAKKNDYKSACEYFKLFNNINKGEMLFDNFFIYDDKRFINREGMYFELFSKEFNYFSKYCN